MKCNQQNCDREAAYLFTWPGEDQAGICEACAPKLRGVASAIGLHVQLIPMTTSEDEEDADAQG